MPAATARTQPAAPKTKKSSVPIFLWEAKTKSGEVKKGEMEANDAAAVDARLKSRWASHPEQGAQEDVPRCRSACRAGGVKSASDLLIFVRQFATMIDAGLPLVQCLDILASQEPNKTFKSVLYDVKGNVESGATFADSLKRHPKVFDTLFCNLVAAGEVGGILDTILNRLAAYIEKNVKLMRQVKGALTYPIGILVVAVVVVAALLKWVIPTFEKMFKDFGNAKLPSLTQMVINVSHWFGENFYYVAVGIFLVVFGFKKFLGTEKGRRMFDAFILKMPVIGDLIRKVAVAKFTRTLGTMISSGVPILDSLDIVARSAGNKTIESAIYFVRDKISEGSNMADPLSKTGVFPSMVVQMIAVGESTGAMDTMLNKIADFYEEEVEVAVNGLTKLIEPFMMVFLGGVVGTVLIAMYLPIFSIAGAIK
jgi:type IV pilus assembly protein PilC